MINAFVASAQSKSNMIFFAPINTIDLINPSIQLGYERRINKLYAYQIEYGYILNHSLENYLIDKANGIKDCEYSNKGYKIRMEFKYFVGRKWFNAENFYISSELFYTKNKSNVTDSFLISDTSFVYSFGKPEGVNYGYDDFFTMDKQRFGLNLKFGSKLWLNNIVVEPHIGIGIVYRKTVHYNRENLKDEFYDKTLSFYNVPGNKWILNLPWNIKFGYSF